MFIFFKHFSISTLISNFIKIRPVGAELFRADRQTDMTKLTVAFRNYKNAPQRVATNTTELSVGFTVVPSAVLQLCSCVVLQLCSCVVLQLCRSAVLQLCSSAVV